MLQDDPHLWLEDVTSDKALAWVREKNAATGRELENAAFKTLEGELLAIMDSKDKIPHVTKAGGWYYNLWKDTEHKRGLWRRTTLEEYRKKDPKWETVLDFDALAAAEHESWVVKGMDFLPHDWRRCLVSLSRGGADAHVTREFDVEAKQFVTGGFTLPEAKSGTDWIDRDTLFVSTDVGPGSLTASGYPRVVKKWKRGSKLQDAVTIFEGKSDDIAVHAWHDHMKGFERDFVQRSVTFFSSELYVNGKKLDVPDEQRKSVHKEWLLVHLRKDWLGYPQGTLLATKLDDFMAGKRDMTALFTPAPTTALQTYAWTKDYLILNVLEDVKNRLTVITPGTWKSEPLLGAPALGTVSASPVDAYDSNAYFMSVTDYVTPTTLLYGSIGKQPEVLRKLPAFFDATGMTVTQHFATSKDGTRVPYFQVTPKTPSGATLLTGYGGFEVTQMPAYSGSVGKAWLSKGGTYVVANIRGGGEYGPRWHQAALKQHRPRAYEDFAAVAEALIQRKVTAPKQLGIIGGSNGGLLVGNMLTRYPQLFGAVVCQVPLLDMKRYTHLLAGASWMAEYGDPDKPEEWAFIETFSPYHNVKQGVTYPPTLLMTSTRDDRVHPGHARKMMAKLSAVNANVRYYENIEGGHGGAADNKQSAHMWALAFTFLHKQLR